MSRIAIHGFGRIGRSLMKVALKDGLFVPVSISDIKDLGTLAALFEVDSNYGRWSEPVATKGGGFSIGGRDIAYVDSMKSLPDWKALGIDLVIDCTGRASTRAGPRPSRRRRQARARERAKQDAERLRRGAAEDQPRDLRSGETQDHQHGELHDQRARPVVKVVIENFGIKHGLFSTVHAYTNTQSLTDQPMKDRRDSWAATENIIPSSSGAARALAFIWKGLKISGKAYRARPHRQHRGAEPAHRAAGDRRRGQRRLRKAAGRPLKGVMAVLEDEWASARILGDPHSSLVDLPLTAVQGDLLSVAAWYDNEMGYAAASPKPRCASPSRRRSSCLSSTMRSIARCSIARTADRSPIRRST